MEVIYGRISTKGQQDNSQLKDGVKSFIDVISGTVPFMERPQAKKLIAYLKKNPTEKTTVSDLSRLGRNTADVLNTVEYFKKHNYTLEIKDRDIKTDTPTGKMMLTMLSAVYEMELEHIRQRTQRGRDIAKAKGNVYKGRKKGATAKAETLLAKHSDIVNCLKADMTMSETARTVKKNRATVKRISTILKASTMEYRQHSILEQIEETK